MDATPDPWTRWQRVIAAIVAEQQWGLSETDQQRYLAALRNLVPTSCSEEDLRRACVNYHLDHQLVQALHNHTHPNHHAAWATWMAQAIQILRKTGLDWASDGAVELEDLAQIAQLELLRALPSFRYASRFTTWAHTVVVQRIRRYLRDSQAARRAQRPTSLELEADSDALVDTPGQLESTCAAHVLAATCHAILAALPDQRLPLIFQLWALEDRSTMEIGKLVHLHPSRVRALLVHIRQLLQEHPTIRDWAGKPSAGESTHESKVQEELDRIRSA